MREYYLTTKSGEVLNKVRETSRENAIKYFSILKKISTSDLINIYKIL